eukprot:6656253-Prorocentrum_lima.AAC.1
MALPLLFFGYCRASAHAGHLASASSSRVRKCSQGNLKATRLARNKVRFVQPVAYTRNPVTSLQDGGR